jgi:glycosyltransferase involved in cell wall biosynthesis
MFQRAARVVTVSEALRQRTIDRWHLDPSQVNTVPNGADMGLFAQEPDVDVVRSRYGLDGEPVVIFVGSFKPWHGLDLLLDAFCRVTASNQDAKLVFVGDGPARPGLESQARKLNLEARVVFTGAVAHTDVASLLTAAQVAVLNPRASEASLSQSPLKLFEYMAAGKAIVAPAIPNVKQILAHRKNALLVPPDQAEALAGALEELLNNEQLRTRLGQAARKQSLENHSWDRTVSRLEAIIDDELRVKNAGA